MGASCCTRRERRRGRRIRHILRLPVPLLSPSRWQVSGGPGGSATAAGTSTGTWSAEELRGLRVGARARSLVRRRGARGHPGPSGAGGGGRRRCAAVGRGAERDGAGVGDSGRVGHAGGQLRGLAQRPALERHRVWPAAHRGPTALPPGRRQGPDHPRRSGRHRQGPADHHRRPEHRRLCVLVAWSGGPDRRSVRPSGWCSTSRVTGSWRSGCASANRHAGRSIAVSFTQLREMDQDAIAAFVNRSEAGIR
jgi:hypothetical protein